MTDRICVTKVLVCIKLLLQLKAKSRMRVIISLFLLGSINLHTLAQVSSNNFVSSKKNAVTLAIIDTTRTYAIKDTVKAIQYAELHKEYLQDSLFVELFILRSKLTNIDIDEYSNRYYENLLSEFHAFDNPELFNSIIFNKAKQSARNREYKLAENLYKFGSHLSHRAKLVEYENEIDINLSGVLLRRSKFKEANLLLSSLIKRAEEQKDTNNLNIVLKNKAVCQSYLGQLDSSIINHSKVLNYAIELRDSTMMIKALTNIGNVHMRMKNFVEAKNYLRESIKICKKVGRIKSMANCYASIGTVFEQEKIPDSSSYYFERALQITDNIDYPQFKNKVKGALGSSYYFSGQLYKAERLLEEALLNEKSPHVKSAFLQRLGLIKRDRNDMQGAVKSFENALEIGVESNDISVQIACHKALAKIYKDASNFKNGFDHLISMNSLKDSIYNIEKTKIIADYDKKYRLNKKETENKLLSKDLEAASIESSNYKRLIMLLMAFLFSLAMLIRNLWKTGVLKKSHNALLVERNMLLSETNRGLVFELEELKELNDKLSKNVAVLPVASNYVRKIEIQGVDKVHIIDFDDILYVTAEDNGARVISVNGVFWSPSKLKEITLTLPNERFVRVFRSTVVNINKLKWINHSTLMMQNGDELKIGRTYKSDIQRLVK